VAYSGAPGRCVAWNRSSDGSVSATATTACCPAEITVSAADFGTDEWRAYYG
jgi:hypothetical protein